MHLFLPLPSIYIYPFMQNNVHGYFCRNCSIFHMTIRINYQQYMSRMNKIAKNKLVCSIAMINIYVCLFRRSKIIEALLILNFFSIPPVATPLQEAEEVVLS